MFKKGCIYIATTGAAWHSAFLKKKRLCTVYKFTPGGSLFGFVLVFEKGFDQCLSIWYRSVQPAFLNAASEGVATEATELAVLAAEGVAASELVAGAGLSALVAALGLATGGGTGLVAASSSAAAG